MLHSQWRLTACVKHSSSHPQLSSNLQALYQKMWRHTHSQVLRNHMLLLAHMTRMLKQG